MIALLTGLLAGAGHVIAGPDHWVAITPLSMSQPTAAVKLGLRWSLGHAVGVLSLGALGLYLRDTFVLNYIVASAEATIGVVLVVTGIWALRRARTLVIHSHEHMHDAAAHKHAHIHVSVDEHESHRTHQGHSHAATSFGLLAGVAGSGHLWGVLPSLALPQSSAIAYLLAFVLGSTLAMTGFAYGVGRLARNEQVGNRLRRTMTVAGVSAVVFGGYWLFIALKAAQPTGISA
jgi:hypothetical protein